MALGVGLSGLLEATSLGVILHSGGGLQWIYTVWVLNSKGVMHIAATPNAEGSAQGPNNPSTYTG